jgi:hypothetical protein
MEKETLEEASERYENKDQHKRSKLDFIEGAKWQSKRMYSEIELEVAFFEGRENNLPFTEWFNQFKKTK